MPTQTKETLFKNIWQTANDLRGTLDESDFKSYVLGTLFYRFISEKIAGIIESTEDGLVYADYTEEIPDEVRDSIIDEVGYFVYPNQLFCNIAKNAETNDNLNVDLYNAIHAIETNSKVIDGHKVLDGCFLGMNPSNEKLGRTIKERNERLTKLLKCIEGFDIHEAGTVENDIFGDAFEYMMGLYASNAGKVGGEYYTPSEVGELLARLTTTDNKDIATVYDPTAGSGGLVLKFAKVIGADKDSDPLTYYGQEINATTHALSRMNMLVHGVSPSAFHFYCGNTLTDPAWLDKKPFDVIVSNPPYSLKWDGKDNVQLANDERFTPAGVLAPKSKADLAFVMHALNYLSEDGKAGIVLFPGTLYREGAEKAIRKYLVDNNYIEGIIQMPANLFYGTTIATAVVVLKKGKEDSKVRFINASDYFVKAGKMNQLTKENIDTILNYYTGKEDVKGIAKTVDIQDIANEDYKLTVSTYVESIEEEKIDIEEVNRELEALEERQGILRKKIHEIVEEIM